jgi:hypothetical protein
MKTLARISAAAAGIALFAMSGTASALTYQGAVFSASATGSGTSWDVTVTMDFTNADATNEFLGDAMEAWSLGLPGAATLSLTTAPGAESDWSINATGKADATGCGGGNVNAICVDWGSLNTIQGGGPQIDLGDTFTFVIHVDFAAAQNSFDTALGGGNFHLLSVRLGTTGCGNNPSPCWTKDGGLISLPIGGDDDDVPEPGTLALLGLGLLGLGVSRRRLSK